MSEIQTQTQMMCKNHPDRETRVSCASCGAGLCPSCMVYTPVGIKCRECASPSRGMLRQGKPSQYIGAAVAGLLASAAGGLIFVFILGRSLIFSIFLGFLIGEAVRRGARGNRGPAFVAIAAVTAFLGLVLVGYALSPMGLLFSAIVAGVAAYRLSQ